MASFMPPVSDKHRGLGGLMSAHVWRNHIIWRAGVSLASQSLSANANTSPSSAYLVSDHRRCSFRAAELHIRFFGRNTIDLATRSSTCGDTLRQRDPYIVSRFRHGSSNRRTHQPAGDNGHRALGTLSSCPSNNIHLLSARWRCARRSSPSRSSGEKVGVRDPQRRLLDRPRRRSQRLASGLD